MRGAFRGQVFNAEADTLRLVDGDVEIDVKKSIFDLAPTNQFALRPRHDVFLLGQEPLTLCNAFLPVACRFAKFIFRLVFLMLR
jgi:hypothetical protein